MPPGRRAARGVGLRLWRSKRARIAIAVLLLGSAAFWWMLPRPLFREPLSAILLARDGSLLGARIADDGQWRFPELAIVPERFAQALIHYEDRRFQRHPGVDPLAMVRALRSNWQAGRVVSGASTLTMQLARLVKQQGSTRRSRSYLGKAVQTLLALRLECSYSKRELLALYASHAPFGGNVVGLDAAAWRYFGRDPAQLTWAEAATLAVLPNAPGLISPGRARATLLLRRDRLLQKLTAAGALTELDLTLALAEPLVEAPRSLPDGAPHLLETLRQRYPEQHRFASTIDPQLQRQAVELVQRHAAQLQRSGVNNAAALIVDNRSFEVLAYVGNAAWQVNSQRALAVDIVQRPRSTGSILKPFLYAAMLDSGQLLPKMLVPDIPTQMRGFTPENFDRSFRGAVAADVALAQSLNVPAVRLLRDYGYPRFHDLLQRLGFSTLSRPPGHYGLTLILGGAEATLWDVVGAYANLADGARPAGSGARVGQQSLHWLRAVTTTSVGSAAQARPLSIGAAWLTQVALLEVSRPVEEANWRTFANSRQIAWKTGTSWGLRDAWAVGSSTHYTVGVWAGNADGVGVPELTGSVAAGPLLFALHDRLPHSPWYDMPVGALKTVQTCADDGFLASDLCAKVEALVPQRSHFDHQSPYHQLVHLDAAGHERVVAGCERVAQMRHRAWFVLPPALEHYYRGQHSDYRPLPPWRADCAVAAANEQRSVMEFLYPGPAGRIYVPVELDGRKGRAVLEVVHREPTAVLYWHVDDDYVGHTELAHQLAVDLAPGVHSVTVVDAAGNRQTRRFEVLARDRGYTSGQNP
jgi:penicillin-binding protein 1C